MGGGGGEGGGGGGSFEIGQLDVQGQEGGRILDRAGQGG